MFPQRGTSDVRRDLVLPDTYNRSTLEIRAFSGLKALKEEQKKKEK